MTIRSWPVLPLPVDRDRLAVHLYVDHGIPANELFGADLGMLRALHDACHLAGTAAMDHLHV